MPVGDGQGGGSKTDRQKVKDWVQQWAELDEYIKNMMGPDGVKPTPDDIERWKAERRALADKVVGLVETKDHLWDVAVNMGFNESILEDRVTGSSADGGGSGSGNSNNNDGSGNGSGSGGSGGDGNGKGGKGGGKSESYDKDKGVILGRLGKDYQLVRSGNGKYAVVYNVKIGNKNVKVAWDISDKEMEKAGLTKNDAKLLTKNQWKKIERFGSVDDIPDFRYDDKRNPFDKTVEYIQDIYGGQGILKNKEVAQILAAGYIEGLSEQQILGKIRQTDWYNSRSNYQRNWLTLGKADKDDIVQGIKVRMKADLEGLWGDEWMNQVNAGELDKWAEKVASGNFGFQRNADDAYNAWLLRQTKQAQGSLGTPAQVSHDEQQQELVNSSANPEIMYESIREMAQEWLGSAHIPAQDYMMKWAKQLAAGDKSEVDFENYLKRQKQAIHSYLDPDEKWMDAAAVYKSSAERLWGMEIGYDDPVLQNFMAFGEDGKALDRRMSVYDFENKVRQDARFKTSATANEEAASLGNFLTSMFTGGGGF